LSDPENLKSTFQVLSQPQYYTTNESCAENPDFLLV